MKLLTPTEIREKCLAERGLRPGALGHISLFEADPTGFRGKEYIMLHYVQTKFLSRGSYIVWTNHTKVVSVESVMLQKAVNQISQ